MTRKIVIFCLLLFKLFKVDAFTNRISGTSENFPPTSNKSCGLGKYCVFPHLCKDHEVADYGEDFIDVRLDSDSVEKCLPGEECCSVPELLPVHEDNLEGCGYRNADGIGFRIINDNDEEAQFGEFPWMVAVLLEEQVGSFLTAVYLCGGSIIHPSVVLTAAHCVSGRSTKGLIARAGEWDVESKIELLPDQDRYIAHIVVHERYYRRALFNDIAILYLEKPFEIARNVRPVCLPPHNKNFDHSRCLVSGWGKDAFRNAGKYQTILRKVDVPIVPRDRCEALLRTTRLGRYFSLHPSFICAGGERGKDSCEGDGGSPLVCPIAGYTDRFYQAGIVAWGIGCGGPIPGVYVDTANLRAWIDEQLAKENIFVENVW